MEDVPREDGGNVGEIRFNPVELRGGKGGGKLGDGFCAGRRVCDDLGNHRIIVRRDFATALDPALDPAIHAHALGETRLR